MLELLLAPICLVIDQYSKNKAIKEIPKLNNTSLMGGKLLLGLVYNEGAFLGMLSKKKQLLMIANIFSIAVLVFIIVSVFFSKGYHLVKFGISLMTGGALGNIYDRIKRKKVVDFLAFGFKPNIYLNFADIFVFIGGILVFIGSVLIGSKK